MILLFTILLKNLRIPKRKGPSIDTRAGKQLGCPPRYFLHPDFNVKSFINRDHTYISSLFTCIICKSIHYMYNICKAERSALVTSTWEYKIDISWLPYSNYGAVLMYTCTLTSLQTYSYDILLV